MPRGTLLRVVLPMVVLAATACGWAGRPQGTAAPAEARPTDTPQAAVEPTESGMEATAESPGAGGAAPDPFEIAWEDRSLFREGLIETEQAILDGLPGATVYHMDLQISDDLLLLEGHQEVLYTNREDAALDEVYFRLFPNTAGGRASLSAVRVDGQDVEPIYAYRNSAARVPLPVALEPGEQVVIAMDFTVEVAQEMGGNYGLFGYFGDVLVLDEFYPVIPVYDDEGWNVEDPPTNGDLTYYDASLYLVRVTAPAGLSIIGSGIEVGRGQEGDSQVVTLAAGPARDFYLAVTGRYIVTSEVVGETTVNSYTFPEWEEAAAQALRHAADALSAYNARFGTYPYTEFDVISTPMLAGGIEYPGMTAISVDMYDLSATVAGLPSYIMLEATIAHEVGHQWFYNVVGNDQVDEPWLDEAIVQYVTSLYYADLYGEEGAQGYRDSWGGRWERVEYAEMPIGLPSADYTRDEYSAIVYGRGPYFVLTLSEEMGQETFDAFLRDYYQSNKWGIGTAESFRELAEEHCQCDLSAVFEEWVYEK